MCQYSKDRIGQDSSSQRRIHRFHLGVVEGEPRLVVVEGQSQAPQGQFVVLLPGLLPYTVGSIEHTYILVSRSKRVRAPQLTLHIHHKRHKDRLHHNTEHIGLRNRHQLLEFPYQVQARQQGS